MKYMLMMNAPKTGWETFTTWPREVLHAHIEFMKSFTAKLAKAGELVAAEGLDMPSNAKIVRAGKHGKSVTDGPFAETKEFLAGYWIVQVNSPERAYEIAAEASAAPGPGGVPMNMPIEVRMVAAGPPEV